MNKINELAGRLYVPLIKGAAVLGDARKAIQNSRRAFARAVLPDLFTPPGRVVVLGKVIGALDAASRVVRFFRPKQG